MGRSFPERKRSIATLALVFGALFLAVGLSWLATNVIFRIRATPADGTIVQLLERRGNNGRVYTPVVKFQDLYGQEHELKSNYSSNPPIGGIGDHVRVLYLKSNPKDARIDSAFFIFIFPSIFAFIGLISALIGLLLMRNYRRANKLIPG